MEVQPVSELRDDPVTRDPRNLLAIVFVLAGLIPILIWLVGWAQQNMRAEQLVQIGLVLACLIIVWRLRVAWEKRNARRSGGSS
jgi:hypothetical protein